MNRRERTQSHQLDRALDRLTRHSSPADGNGQLDPELTRVADRLFQLSARHEPTPNEQFITRLEQSLMSSTQPVSPTGLAETRPRVQTSPIAPRRSPAERRDLVGKRRHRGWTAWLEIVSIATVLILIFGATVGPDRLLDPFRRTNTAVQPANPGPEGMYRGSAARTGVMPSLGPEGEPGILWRHADTTLSSESGVTPVIAGGTLYIVSPYIATDFAGVVTAINVTNGSQRWQVRLGDAFPVSPVIANGLVYVLGNPEPTSGGDDGFLIALDVATGVERWRYETGRIYRSSPAIANGSIYLMAEDGTLRAVDALSGAEQWRFALDASDLASPRPGTTGEFATEGDSPFSPAVSDGIVYAASDDGVLFAVDAASGKQRWRFVSDGNYLQTAAITDGKLFLITQIMTRNPELMYSNNWLYALDAATGQTIWTWNDGVSARPPTVANDRVYIAASQPDGTDAAILALDANTGTELWSSPDGGYSSATVLAGTTLYATRSDGGLYAIDTETGDTVWRVDLGTDRNGDPVVADGKVIVVSNNELLAIAGSVAGPGTPVATPLVDGDASGLAPCTVEPRENLDSARTGTPSAGLAPGRAEWENATRKPILLTEIPDGQPARQEDINGILDTLAEIAVCDRPGYSLQLAALVTDDFLRRSDIWISMIEWSNGNLRSLVGAVTVDGEVTTALADVRELPDGRIGVLRFNPVAAGNGEFTIFAKHGDRWLLDETRQFAPTLELKG